MTYAVKLLPSAAKDMDTIHGRDYESVKSKIFSLSDNPRSTSAIKLTNDDGYRIRSGDYRVLYRIDDKAKEVFIYRVKLRKDAYRY